MLFSSFWASQIFALALRLSVPAASVEPNISKTFLLKAQSILPSMLTQEKPSTDSTAEASFCSSNNLKTSFNFVSSATLTTHARFLAELKK